MLARVAHVTMFVMVTWSFVVAGTRTATAQALCPQTDARPFGDAEVRGFAVELPRAPHTVTVEADLRAFADTLLGGTWRMPASAGIAVDDLALEGVSLTRSKEPGLGSNVHTFDVVSNLRASDNVVTDLELVVVDGERSLRLGAFTDITVRCQAMSVSRTFSISDHDFVSFIAAGRAPKLRVKRTTRISGC